MIMKKQKLSWRAVKQPVSKLKKLKKNPRMISTESFDRLKERIKSRGFHDVVKVDTDGTILSGNQRKDALVELGMKDVITLVPNRKLTKEEREKVILESNINDGSWDTEGLKSFDLSVLTDVGLDEVELSEFWKEDEIKEDNFNVDEEVKKIKKPKTKLGDLIILGRSKLICGDSNDPRVLKRLFENEKTSLILSDPIYNLQINYNKGLGGKRSFGGNVNDSRTESEYIEFLRRNISSALSVSNPDCHIFYFNTEEQIWILQTLYREFNIKNRRVCLWVKNGQNETPQVAFSKCYEPAIYGTLGQPYLSTNEYGLNQIMNSEIGNGNDSLDSINLWTSKRVTGKKMVHATQKPSDLYQKAIRRCSKVNDIILDSFGGSGSTLIACEQLKRRAFLVEKEPVFCDLIIKRFEALTGIKAKVIHEKRKS